MVCIVPLFTKQLLYPAHCNIVHIATSSTTTSTQQHHLHSYINQSTISSTPNSTILILVDFSSALNYVDKIWDANFWEHLVIHSNNYAKMNNQEKAAQRQERNSIRLDKHKAWKLGIILIKMKKLQYEI